MTSKARGVRGIQIQRVSPKRRERRIRCQASLFIVCAKGPKFRSHGSWLATDIFSSFSSTRGSQFLPRIHKNFDITRSVFAFSSSRTIYLNHSSKLHLSRFSEFAWKRVWGSSFLFCCTWKEETRGLKSKKDDWPFLDTLCSVHLGISSACWPRGRPFSARSLARALLFRSSVRFLQWSTSECTIFISSGKLSCQ